MAAALRAEWRAEEEHWSRAAVEQWEHGRTLVDVARASMHRGDVVTFAFPDVVWFGTVLGVGNDVVRLQVSDAPVDVRVVPDAPFVLRASRGPDDGGRGDATVTTFVARLREVDGARVRLGTALGSIEGRLRAGGDQVRITDGDGGVAYVPAGSVRWVRPLDVD